MSGVSVREDKGTNCEDGDSDTDLESDMLCILSV